MTATPSDGVAMPSEARPGAAPASQSSDTPTARIDEMVDESSPRTVEPVVDAEVTEALAEVREQFDAIGEEETRREELVVGRAVTVSGLLTAGYLVWMFRGASIIAGVLTSLPVWRMVDPLAVLPAPRAEGRPRRWWHRRPVKSSRGAQDIESIF